MQNRRLELSVAALVFAVVVLIELGSDIHPDLWWQLLSGEHILQDGFPGVDRMTWTQVDVTWQVHGWLSHAILGVVNGWLGLGALPVFFAVLLGAMWAGLFWVSPGNPLGRAAVTLVAAAAANPLTSPRSATISIVLLAAIVMISELIVAGRWPRPTAWVLPPLFMFWVNLDSWYIVGFVYLAARILAARLSTDSSDEVSDRVGALILAGVAGLFATLINPYGWDAWPAAVARLEGGPRRLVVELQSPDFQLQTVWPWIIFVGGIVLLMAFRSRVSAMDVVIFFGFLIPALISYQYVAVHAVVAVIVGAGVAAVGRSDRAPAGAVWVATAAVAVLAVIVGSAAVDQWERGAPETYPVAAADFIVNEGLAEVPVFNELFWGGYLARREIPPFSDTRYQLYGGDFMVDAINAMNALPAWEEIDVAYRPGVAIVRGDRGLAQYLAASTDWSEVYVDEVARVFVRQDQ